MQNEKSAPYERPYKALGNLVRKHLDKFSQTWLANQLGVSSQFINMIVHGKKRFSKNKLCQFAVLTKENIETLAELSRYEITDVMQKYHPAFLMHSDIDNCIYQMGFQISLAKKTREFGEPELAKSQLFFTIETLQNRIQMDNDHLKDIRDLKYWLIRAYAERMACNNDVMLRGLTVNAVLPDFYKLQTLAIQINDDKGLAIGHSWLAGAYYVDHDFKNARGCALKALAFLNDDSSYLAETLRGLMIDHARLKDINGFNFYRSKSLDSIDNGFINTPMDIATIFEGIGQSETHLGDLNAINAIQKSEEEMRKLNDRKKSRPLKYLQINRSKLEYDLEMKIHGYTLDQNTLNDHARKAENSANSLKDYVRHREEINHLIKCLNIPTPVKARTSQQLKLFY